MSSFTGNLFPVILPPQEVGIIQTSKYEMLRCSPTCTHVQVETILSSSHIPVYQSSNVHVHCMHNYVYASLVLIHHVYIHCEIHRLFSVLCYCYTHAHMQSSHVECSPCLGGRYCLAVSRAVCSSIFHNTPAILPHDTPGRVWRQYCRPAILFSSSLKYD